MQLIFLHTNAGHDDQNADPIRQDFLIVLLAGCAYTRFLKKSGEHKVRPYENYKHYTNTEFR